MKRYAYLKDKAILYWITLPIPDLRRDLEVVRACQVLGLEVRRIYTSGEYKWAEVLPRQESEDRHD